MSSGIAPHGPKDWQSGRSGDLADLVLAIPALNEERRIGAALKAAAAALAQADGSGAIVILANNCVDQTAEVVRQTASQIGIPVHLSECRMPASLASAGHARRLSLEIAANRAAPGAVLMTSDADAVLDTGAATAVQKAIASGADLVCGGFSTRLDPEVLDAVSIRRINAVEVPYRALCHRIRFAMDRMAGRQSGGPRPHYIEAGACQAVTLDFFDRMGGLPPIAASEDRALVRAAERVGARIVYCDQFHAWASARLDGRAAGGMAETIRARLGDPDPFADQELRDLSTLRWVWQAVLLGSETRSLPAIEGPRLRASDLERDLVGLDAFVTKWVEPGFEEWQRMAR